MKKTILAIITVGLSIGIAQAGSVNIGIGIGFDNKSRHHHQHQHHPSKPHLKPNYYSNRYNYRPGRYDYNGHRGYIYADNHHGYSSIQKHNIGFYGKQPNIIHHTIISSTNNQINWRNFSNYNVYEPPIDHKWIKVEKNLLLVNMRDNSVVKLIELN